MLRQSHSWVFMGVIQHGRLSPDPAKIQAVTKWLVPTTRRQLQQVLGFANFYHRVIRNYTRVAMLLLKLTSTRRLFSWSEEA